MNGISKQAFVICAIIGVRRCVGDFGPLNCRNFTLDVPEPLIFTIESTHAVQSVSLCRTYSLSQFCRKNDALDRFCTTQRSAHA